MIQLGFSRDRPKKPPGERQQPLPWQHPAIPEDDPDAEARVRAIMASPSYREADRDPDFLHQQEMRGARLQVDYAKAESVLRAYGIERTIIVFGSTRIPDPAVARRRLDELQRRLARQPDDQRLRRQLAVAGRILDNSRYYDVARDLGRLVGSAQHGGERDHLAVMTGGGPGIMEAANRGAFDVGADTIGLNISLPHEQQPNPYVTPDLCFLFHYFALRKLHFMLRACALVACPGGYGTMDELFESLTLIQTRTIDPLPVVLVGECFWRRAFNVDFLVDEGVIDEEDRDLFWFAETAQEAWDGILQWHRNAGVPLVNDGGA
ncbi:MAG: LOG family protein [Chromatiaceae bacterium]|nr:LOG family protein [Chromatiaceae bacterium]MCP5437451.1 LOG family protein [Chromatiaceae bacterium]MCP5440046.1 LOG family protein [Chromatiaceae bacterium]HPE78981.1 LOG family protein [Gammaproteobacteria bacterium]